MYSLLVFVILVGYGEIHLTTASIEIPKSFRSLRMAFSGEDFVRLPGCAGSDIYCDCQPSTAWKGIMGLQECSQTCKGLGRGMFVHATDGDNNCKCILESATCGYAPDAAERFGLTLYKHLDGGNVANEMSTIEENMPTPDFGAVFSILDTTDDGLLSEHELVSPHLELNDLKDFLNVTYDATSFSNGSDPSYEDFENIIFRYTGKIGEEQSKVARKVFDYLDEDNDEKLSLEDFKLKILKTTPFVFDLLDTDDDGFISFQDIDFRIHRSDIDSILSAMDGKGELNLNELMVPFGFDVNGDGTMNNLDLYLTLNSYGTGNINYLSRILRLLDQDQDGIYTIDDVKDFVDTMWDMLDANKDTDVSLEDGYILLQTKFQVDHEKVSILEGYLNDVKTSIKQISETVAGCVFRQLDKDGNAGVTMDEFYNIPEVVTSGAGDEMCFHPEGFPQVPLELVSPEFFPPSQYISLALGNGQWQPRSIAFILASFDSSKFYKQTEPCIDTFSIDCNIHIWACEDPKYSWYKDKCKKTCGKC